MQYCTLKFQIKYTDGNEVSGNVPFRGESLNEKNLLRFVKNYFAGPKKYNKEDIFIQIEKEYEDPKQWLLDIKNWDTFKDLRKINNFAGDIMAEFFPGE